MAGQGVRADVATSTEIDSCAARVRSAGGAGPINEATRPVAVPRLRAGSARITRGVSRTVIVVIEGIISGGSSYYESLVSSELLGDQFFRLNPRIPNFSKTDPSVVPALISIANKTNLRPAFHFIEKNWKE